MTPNYEQQVVDAINAGDYRAALIALLNQAGVQTFEVGTEEEPKLSLTEKEPEAEASAEDTKPAEEASNTTDGGAAPAAEQPATEGAEQPAADAGTQAAEGSAQ